MQTKPVCEAAYLAGVADMAMKAAFDLTSLMKEMGIETHEDLDA